MEYLKEISTPKSIEVNPNILAWNQYIVISIWNPQMKVPSQNC
jgi:hypothetical protein